MTQGTVHIRRATSADLDSMARMGAALARLHHEFDPQRFMFEEDFVDGYRWWFERELKQKRTVSFFVVDAGPPVGVCGYLYGRLEERDWNQLLDKHAALVDVWVDPAARRSGAGLALVRAFCAWADEQGAPRVVLSTATRNTAAQAMFERAGFRRTMIEMTRERDGG